jgi:Caspase domain
VTNATQATDLHFAVVVGIDHYLGFTDLTTARADASKFNEWLVDPDYGAVPAANVVYVEGSPPATEFAEVRPTQRQVNDALHQVCRDLESRLTQDPGGWERSRLYIFVAGHGIKPRGGGGALLMADATPEILGYHVDMRKYINWFRQNAPFKEVLAFADCCRTRGDCSYAYGPPFTNRRSSRKATAVLGYAAAPGQPAHARPSTDASQHSRGLFTDALLKALRGAAADPHGDVTLASIENYVDNCLAVTATAPGGRQRVDFVPTDNSCVVIRTKRRPGRRAIRFVFETPFVGVASLCHGDLSTEDIMVGSREVRRSLKPGLYELTDKSRGGVTFRKDGTFRVPDGDGDFDVIL